MSGLPFLKFYPSDWLSEESLRLVSLSARGLWIDLLCLMAKNERRGYLQVNGGVNPSLAQIGKLVGSTEAELAPLMRELEDAKVFSVDENGTIYSRRIVRDTVAYDQAVSYGKQGGNPKLKRSAKGGVKGEGKGSSQPSLDSGILDSSSGSEDRGNGGKGHVTVIPLLLSTEEFKAAWGDWLQHRREKRKPVTPMSEKQAFKELEAMGVQRAIAAIRHSIGKGWTGIFEPDPHGSNGTSAPTDAASAERRRQF